MMMMMMMMMMVPYDANDQLQATPPLKFPALPAKFRILDPSVPQKALSSGLSKNKRLLLLLFVGLGAIFAKEVTQKKNILIIKAKQ